MRRAAFLGCLALAAPVQDGHYVAELALEGPLEEVVIDNGAQWTTHVRAALGPRESRTVRVPIAVTDLDPGEDLPALDVRPAGGGGDATLTDVAAGEDPFTWRRLPFGLQRRSLPPLRPQRPAADLSRLALLLAAGVAGFALWRRPASGLLVGAGCCALCLLLPGGGVERAEVRVFEGDGQSGVWLVVHGGLDALELRVGARHWCESVPFDEARRFEVEVGDEVRWSLAGSGLALYSFEELADWGTYAPEGNAARSLSETWRRTASGTWTRHGVWHRGQPLPAAEGQPGAAPPGWLASALPQGVGVLIGRVAGEAGTWVRLIGF